MRASHFLSPLPGLSEGKRLKNTPLAKWARRLPFHEIERKLK